MPTRQTISGPVTTVQRARKLRREMTLPEVKLWGVLRERPGGFKFRRQHPAGVYILDFYCAAVRLAIEVDGWAHDTGGVAKADAARGAALREQHIATLRVPATVVLEDVEPVVTRIVAVCEERAEKLAGLRKGHPTPLGEGTQRSWGEGLARVILTWRWKVTLTQRRFANHPHEYSREPLHHLRWSPSPKGKDGVPHHPKLAPAHFPFSYTSRVRYPDLQAREQGTSGFPKPSQLCQVWCRAVTLAQGARRSCNMPSGSRSRWWRWRLSRRS